MKEYWWRTKENFVVATVDAKGNGSIESRIQGIRTWHQYDFNILAFLIKELYDTES